MTAIDESALPDIIETLENGGTADADTLKISVERDLYKNLYEQLLNKLTA